MSRSSRLGQRLTVTVALLGAASVLMPACGEDGESPLCPELKLYTIGQAGERSDPEVEAQRQAAVDAGCMTPLMLDAGTD